ncbi:hypothetical protein [Glycomyces tarimensis]
MNNPTPTEPHNSGSSSGNQGGPQPQPGNAVPPQYVVPVYYVYQAVPVPAQVPVPQPQRPVGPQNGMGMTSLILGIVGAATSAIPFIGCLGWIASILAIVFGSLGLANVHAGKATNRRSAITGLATGIVGLVLGVVIAVAFWNYTERNDESSDAAVQSGAAVEMAGGDPSGLVGSW